MNHLTQTMIDDAIIGRPECDDDYDTTKAKFTWTNPFNGTKWYLPNERSPKRMNRRVKIAAIQGTIAGLQASQSFLQSRLENAEKREEALTHAMIEHAFHFDTALHYNPDRRLFVCMKDFTTREVADAYIKEHLPQVLIDALYFANFVSIWETRRNPTILLPNGKELT